LQLKFAVIEIGCTFDPTKQSDDKKMTTSNGLKVKFAKETGNKFFINTFTGKANSTRFYAVNELGQKGCLPDENTPYYPLGGIRALKEVIDILIWI
jgi:hypothetical protein